MAYQSRSRLITSLCMLLLAALLPAWAQAQCQDGTWSPLGTGTNNTVSALAVMPNGDIVAGGAFTTAGDIACNRIARWNGVTWAPLAQGMNNSVNALAVLTNGDLIAAGDFTIAGGSSANRIARWNGTTWTSLGAGLNSSVQALFVQSNGDLIAGGYFTATGTFSLFRVARWNGSIWSRMNGGSEALHVDAFCMLPNGDFLRGGNLGRSITDNHGVGLWNATTGWSPFQGGLPHEHCFTLTLLPNGNLVAAGTDIQLWNGSVWNSLGTSELTYALAVMPNDGSLVAGGGRFGDANGWTTRGVASWNGTIWTGLGAGTDDTVSSLVVLPSGDLVAGGRFLTAGGVSANHIALWHCQDTWHWARPESGDFDNAENWTPNTVPGPGADIVFDVPGNYTVTLTQDQSVHAAQFLAGNISLSGQYELSTTSDVQISGKLTLAASSLTSSGLITIDSSGTLSLSTLPGQPFELAPQVRSELQGINNDGTLEGAGFVYGNVRNRGTIAPKMGTNNTIASSLYFYGDVNMLEGVTPPVLQIQMLNAFPWATSIWVEGQAHMAGTVRFETTPGVVPPIGTRRVIVNTLPGGEFDRVSRFTRQEGLAIRLDNNTPPQTDTTRFLAVNHGYLEPNSTSTPIEVLVVEAPEVFRGTTRSLLAESPHFPGRNMMFITHGSNSQIHDAPVPSGTLAELAAKSALFAAQHATTPAWDVVTLDWAPFSLNSTALALFSETARMSPEICESLVYWLKAMGRQYNAYHLLSHSSGCWGVDRMADLLVSDGVPRSNIAISFFDLYHAPFRTSSPLGENAGYAEQYMDNDLWTPPLTGEPVPSILNLDVTGFPHSRPLNPFEWIEAAHSWPYRWYIESIDQSLLGLPTCADLASYWGFPRSPLAQAVLANTGPNLCIPNPDWHVLGYQTIFLPGGFRHPIPGTSAWRTGIVDHWVPGTTGSVDVDSNGNINIQTGSPASVQVTYSLPYSTEYIRLTYRYTSTPGSGASGTMTATLEGAPFVEAFESNDDGLPHQTGPIYLRQSIGPGLKTIEFQLVPQNSAQSRIEITNIEFGMSACASDFNADGTTDFFDYLDFVQAFATNSPNADFNRDTVIDFFDYLDFVNAFATGC